MHNMYAGVVPKQCKTVKAARKVKCHSREHDLRAKGNDSSELQHVNNRKYLCEKIENVIVESCNNNIIIWKHSKHKGIQHAQVEDASVIRKRVVGSNGVEANLSGFGSARQA